MVSYFDDATNKRAGYVGPLPDETMRDVRIVHDKVGAYADWFVVNGILPYGDRKERYLLGKDKPNYPVPAVPLTVDITPYGSILWDDREGIQENMAVAIFC